MAIAVGLAFLLSACGDDSSSSASDDYSTDSSSSSIPSTDSSDVIPDPESLSSATTEEGTSSSAKGSSSSDSYLCHIYDLSDALSCECDKSREGKLSYNYDSDVELICYHDEYLDKWGWVKKADESSSSGIDSSSSSVVPGSSSSVIPSDVEGSMTDKRDGQTYKTVKIGEQIWMTENLNYDYNEGTAKSYCYNNSVDSCAKYGRLYLWSAAMDSAAVFSDDGKGCGYGSTCNPSGAVRGVCPEGWHLPSQAEWNTLFTAVGGSSTAGTMLKSQTGWKSYSGVPAGSDAYGFSALPAGSRYSGGSFASVGYYAYFWLSGEYDSGNACYMHLYYDGEYAYLSDDYKYNAFSVRCLKNSNDDAKSSSSEESSSSAKSSSSVVSSSSLAEGQVDPATVVKGEFTDERDGQTYKTVTIGGQIWMAENLNYADSINTVSLKGKSWCYVNKDENCAVAGRLYTWAAAIDSAALASDAENPQTCGYHETCDRLYADGLAIAPIQGVCPEGWHLPSEGEWKALITAVGGQYKAGTALKSQTGWESYSRVPTGSDAYGFSALPAGYRNGDGDFSDASSYAHFWSASQREYGINDALGMYLYYGGEYASLCYSVKDTGRSVRCVKD